MSEYTFQANFKLGKGYDAHLINIVGHDQHEFEANLKWATENAAGIVSTAVALEAAYALRELAPNVTSTTVANNSGSESYAQPASGVYPGNPQPKQAYQQPQAQAGPGPSCTHGAMKYVQAGTSKAGRAYSAFWSCTGPRDSQCKTVDA